MPGIDPISIAAGATSFGQNALNAVLQGAQNRKNRKFAEKMMNRQREWAVQDWNMQNEYNNPANQMQRYKAAGLNPHLIYGQSNEGAQVRSTPSANSEGTAPQFTMDPNSIVGTYNQTRLADVAYDNALKEGQLKDEQKILLKANITDVLASARQKGVNTDRALFDLGIDSELRDTSLEYRRGQVLNQQADRQYTLDNNERQRLASASNLKQAVVTYAETIARKKNIDATTAEIHEKIKLLKLDQELKKDEVELRKSGLTPNSPTYLKVAEKYAKEILGDDKHPTPLKKWWDTKLPVYNNPKHYGGKPPKRFNY